MKKPKKKLIKIWWKIPSIDDIPTNEARELIYRSMQIASDALYYYHGVLEEPNYFRTFWFMTEADKGIQMVNYLIKRMDDPRIEYHAEVR